MQNTLRLPAGVHGKCFRALDNLFRADKLLKSAGVTIYSYRGDVIDSTMPTLAQAPWMRFFPGADSAEMASERQNKVPLVFNLELFVAGLIAENITDFWDYIVTVLYPGDKSVMALIGTAGGYTYELGKPAFQVQMEGEQPVGFYARGTIIVKILQSTPY